MSEPWPLLPEAARSVHRGSIWLRPVPSQPGLYASDRGDIWSVRGGGWRKLKARQQGGRSWDARGGYLRVSIRDYEEKVRRVKPVRPRAVHLLVAEAWHGERVGEVDHKDQNHLNNRPDNLKYLTEAEHREKHNGKGLTEKDWEDIL